MRKSEDFLASSGQILAMIGSNALERGMHTIDAFIQDPKTKVIHRCRLTVELSNQAAIDEYKAEAARQQRWTKQ